MTTPIYGMTEWAANQDQPHATVNVELRILEAMSARIFQDMSLDSPPTGPEDGEVYWVNGAGSGDWAGQTDKIAVNVAGAWHFVTPHIGLVFFNVADMTLQLFDDSTGNGWSVL